ncbi:hypothetical protein SO802_007322 [Lithocarpus litseifolius]|uniref:Reverse transcriptase domain-containing protein n=1 Tax=Lithocarpus litseifolius TaxID=425828 RepID=A0AAW2DQ04_9ROSI
MKTNLLHAGFFQRFWIIVGDSVREEIKKVFRDRKIPEYLNSTNIVLTPKVQGPETIGSYRPISLCNSIYKIISKVLVGRICPYLDKIISPCQAAFVLGRRGVDNAIIVQEVIHTTGKTRGKVGYMTLKIDLEKAYDKLEWSFTRSMLSRFNLPNNLIEIIMSCITTVTTSILFNGGSLEPFSPTRGIRQGDPLFPYIFIMCMEYLGQLIQEKCEEGLWKPVKASRSGPLFSHLFFADDLVLFAKANAKNCMVIRDVLEKFCTESGQTISSSKSRVFFSPNICQVEEEAFLSILGFQASNCLGKYLGFPIRHRGGSNQDFNFVLDKVKTKLAGWKANLLSMARRSVLIQVASSTISSYVMQSSMLPGKVLEGMDRVNRNFLWGSSDNNKKMHWVG